jgi:homoserine O-succinyltransferase/O-acetyltransferase
MPVFLNAKYPGPERRAGLKWPRVHSAAHASAVARQPSLPILTIGLVNNMADKALGATAHQFLSLLEAASPNIEIRLSLYAFPNIARKPSGQRHVGSFYASVETLWNAHTGPAPDGIIVTGREPLMPSLRDEAYWPAFIRLVDWAAEHTCAAVWSCLAAHAAILHMDEISRVRSTDKHFGIFECERVSDHPLTVRLAPRFNVPHSRWNGIQEDRLAPAGYDVLSRTAAGNVDSFSKQNGSLFLFFQGHPEYESDTLLREYRRDVGRYLKGEMDSYPLLPRDYFDEKTAAALNALRDKALVTRSADLLSEVSAVLKKTHIQNTWSASAAVIYRNWLHHIHAQKQQATAASEPLQARAS